MAAWNLYWLSLPEQGMVNFWETGLTDTGQDNFEIDKWKSLGISENTLDLLAPQGFLKPTPVQEATIPLALKDQDLVVSAVTGSGKTAAFCFPMIEKIRGRKGTLGLILCPTREIALQTQEVLNMFAKPQGINTLAVIGGSHMRSEERALKEYPEIIVATPGRMADHQQRGNVWLEGVEIVALDEADRMLDMGFARELDLILTDVSRDRQTLLFSATIVGETERLAKKYLNNPKQISFGADVSVAETIDQKLLWLNDDTKPRELLRILNSEKGSIIVFTRTKVETLQIWRYVHSQGFNDSGYLSSDKTQKDRVQTLERFRSGDIRILFATDVAGRGIHVDDVSYVINYDFPLHAEDYIHRVGRTGRKGAKGKATTFVTPRDSRLLIQVEKMLGKPIPEERVADYSPPTRRPSSTRNKHSRTRGARRNTSSRSKSRGPKKK